MTDYRPVLERELTRVGPARFDLNDVARRRNRRRRNRRFGTVALALAVAALAIGGVVRAFERTHEVRPAGLPEVPGDWSRIVTDLDGQVNAVVAGQPGLVAAGSDADGAAIWTSADGGSWQRVPVADLGPGDVMDITTDGTRLVAVGVGGLADGPDRFAASWTSKDGLHWSRAPYDPVFATSTFANVTAGGPGFVAVGTVTESLSPQAWYSSDGLTWELASVPSEPRGGGRVEGSVADVEVIGDRLIAVGKMFLWTSTDGETWEDVPIDSDVFADSSDIASMTAGPEGLVAVGWYEYRRSVGVWISGDGITWQRVPPKQDAFVSRFQYEGLSGFGASPYEGGGLRSIASSAAGYVAVGADGLCGDPINCPDTEAAVWVSTDGWTWDRVPTAPVFQDGDPDGARTGRWVIARGVVAWGQRFVAWGEFNGRTALWVSGSNGS